MNLRTKEVESNNNIEAEVKISKETELSPVVEEEPQSSQDASMEESEVCPSVESEANEPSILNSTLFKAFRSTTPTPKKSKFFFENNARSAALNSNIFKSHNYDAIAAITSDVGSNIQPGCEMKEASMLHLVFDLHEDAE